jgi:CRISPR locus-related DNA-binding protein
MKSLVQAGADKAIAVHAKRNVRQETKDAIREIKNWVNTEERLIQDEPFEQAVRECISVLNSTGVDDELFVHVGGGERHVALALLYATFFVKRRMRIIVTTRTGEFKTESLPRMPLMFSPSGAQEKVLEALDKDGKPLGEVVAALKGDPKNDSPRVCRHLGNLADNGLVEQDPKTKKYSITFIGKLVREGAK